MKPQQIKTRSAGEVRSKMERQKDLPEGIQLSIVLSNEKVFEFYHFVSNFVPWLLKIKHKCCSWHFLRKAFEYGQPVQFAIGQKMDESPSIRLPTADRKSVSW